MNLNTSILYYTFIIIFIVTAALTLLGVVGVLHIEGAYLNALVGVFILESGSAVIALFKRTNFFETRDTGTLSSLDRSVKIIDRISGQVLNVATGQLSDSDSATNQYRMVFRKSGDEIVAYHRMGTISKNQLDQLPISDRNQIRVWEKSLAKLKKTWDKEYPKRIRSDGSIDQNVENRLQTLVKEMKKDLVAILDFLESQQLYLDDHYQNIRSVVSQYGR